MSSNIKLALPLFAKLTRPHSLSPAFDKTTRANTGKLRPSCSKSRESRVYSWGVFWGRSELIYHIDATSQHNGFPKVKAILQCVHCAHFWATPFLVYLMSYLKILFCHWKSIHLGLLWYKKLFDWTPQAWDSDGTILTLNLTSLHFNLVNKEQTH